MISVQFIYSALPILSLLSKSCEKATALANFIYHPKLLWLMTKLEKGP